MIDAQPSGFVSLGVLNACTPWRGKDSSDVTDRKTDDGGEDKQMRPTQTDRQGILLRLTHKCTDWINKCALDRQTSSCTKTKTR